jgi:hypothetical protein
MGVVPSTFRPKSKSMRIGGELVPSYPAQQLLTIYCIVVDAEDQAMFVSCMEEGVHYGGHRFRPCVCYFRSRVLLLPRPLVCLVAYATGFVM